jgi:hypothetical protein
VKAKQAADEESENPSVNRDNILETKVETEECKPYHSDSVTPLHI